MGNVNSVNAFSNSNHLIERHSIFLFSYNQREEILRRKTSGFCV